MNAGTVDGLLTRELRDDRIALVDATGREYDYHWLCTTSWKAGNFLRHAGVRNGVTVGVVGDGPLALLAFFGTTLLEGTTRFDPPTDLTDEDDFRTLVAPVERVADYELPRGAQRVGYGDKPDAPDIHHFDAGLWSENPSFPPLSIDPETVILTDGERPVTHEGLLKAAREVVTETGLEADDRVVVRTPLSDPRTIAAGVIAPLLAKAVIVRPGDETAGEQASYAVSGTSAESVPEPNRIDLDAVALP
ncbi:hypothetical protein [Natrinema pallidum]|uniref:AMP-dependent synthetase and ligase n=2 Tax=Natrinema pallidum TaxID=69527 RepID=L9Z2N2_9EURY|nr:hypothetical protein [Natrinema pallidum]ELY80161.1 hypothetical protein C487_05269 [Natrinema pallidum DSM 3751]QCW02353.1 hypothetical protein FGF80_03495 [Natrinema pallidum]